MAIKNRRQNFRVDLPLSVPQKVSILGLKETRVRLNDLSLSGCQLAVHTRNYEFFSLNENLDIIINLFNLEDCKLRAKIKVIRKNITKNLLLLGLEFVKPGPESLQDLQSALFRIERLNRFRD